MRQTAKRLFFCLTLLLCAFDLRAQTATTIPFFYEKIYLQTDRDVYSQGEDLWFKAYLVNAQNNKPINYSRNLYVELIRPGLQITLRHVLRMEDGLGNGDFKLPDTLSAGTYRLRAYTNWMRNFGDTFVFEKNITVVNTRGSQSIASALAKPVKRVKKKQSTVGKTDTLPSGPNVSFFAESGPLINDVSSVVAVKAEDEFGKGIPVSGQIFATSGRAVAKFTCDSLGFGQFGLEPDETQMYHAEVTINGELFKFELRKARQKGFTMGVSATSPTIFAEIACNGFSLGEWGGNNLVIVGRHGNKVIYKERVRIQSKNILVQVPDVNFPEGIACITLYDEYAKPLCERLVYVHHPNTTKLKITTDSIAYHSRQKTTVKLKLSDSTVTHLSLAAVDAGVVAVQPGDILQYLELKSEVKGNIEHPERYFDTTNVNRLKQMDLLLMTQGWRDFIWKDIDDTKFKQRYDVEQALPINGHVRAVWADKVLPKMNITMFAPRAAGNKLFSAISDSTGHFRIDGAVLYGYQYVYFTSRKSDGIGEDGKSKGKTGGWIIVDSMFRDKLAVEPVDNILIEQNPVNADSLYERERVKQKFTFGGVNNLKTVQITGYSNALPVQTYPITLAEQKDFTTIGDFVINHIPNAHWQMDEGDRERPPSPPRIFTGYIPPYMFPVSVHGVYTDHEKIVVGMAPKPDVDEYWEQTMDRVLKVTIRGRQTVDGKVYSVELLLRPGSLKSKDFYDNTMADFVGYTKARVFYAPRYEAPGDKPDYRTTIHWEPVITTDAKGEATVSFYNADPKGKVTVVVQGVTDKGVPVSAIAGYVVK